MPPTRPEPGCYEIDFATALPLDEAAEVALEDYARVLTRARSAEAVRAGNDPAEQASRVRPATTRPLPSSATSGLRALGQLGARGASPGLVVIAGLSLCALTAALAAPAPIGLADVLGFATVREVAISPDGRRAAVSVRRGDLEAGAYRTEVWSVDLAGAAAERRLTSGDGGASNLRWSPSGAEIAFVSKRGERAQVWALPAAGGEARPLTAHGEAVSGFEWSPDGGRLLVRAPAPETEEEAQRRRTKDDARADGWQWRRDRLWLVPVAGGPSTPITDGARHVQAAAWAPDGKRVALVTTATPEADSSLDARLQVLDVTTGGQSDVPGGDLAADPRWSRDGRALAFVRPFDGHELSRNDAFVWTVGSDRARNVSASLDRDVEDLGWTSDGTGLEVHHAAGAVSGVARIEVATGRVRPLWMPGRALLSAAHGRAGLGLRARRRPGRGGWRARRASRPSADAWNDGLAGASSRASRSSAGGRRRGGGRRPRVSPTNVDRRGGLLVILHGGPRDHTRPSSIRRPRTHVARVPRPAAELPRQHGYGDAFTRERRELGRGPFDDMMAGVDALIARGLADPAPVPLRLELRRLPHELGRHPHRPLRGPRPAGRASPTCACNT